MSPDFSSPVIVARIVKPHGIKGEVVLESFTDVEGRLENTEVFLLLNHGKVLRELKVETRRFFGGRHVLKFFEVSDRNDAEALRGNELAVPESEIGALPSGQYYIHDLVGSRVFLMDGTLLGEVRKVTETSGASILEIGDRGILIPFVEQICVEVDLENRRIVIDPPEGLLQLYAN